MGTQRGRHHAERRGASGGKGDTIQYADAAGTLTAEAVMLTGTTAKLTVTKEGKTASVVKLKVVCGD